MVDFAKLRSIANEQQRDEEERALQEELARPDGMMPDGTPAPTWEEAYPEAVVELSADQSNALGVIMHWLELGADPIMTLAGHAGTGKTTLVQEVVRRIQGSVALTAPTNKATKVLRKMAEERGIEAFCQTVHSLSSLRMLDNAPEKYLAQMGKGNYGKYDLIVCDEASMIGEGLGSIIIRQAEESERKVLFVGDPLQLLPVSDGGHIAFAAGVPQVHLGKIVRQAEHNPIIRLAEHFRGLLEGRIDPRASFPTSPDDEEGVHWIDGEAFFQRYVAAVHAAGEDVDRERGIAYTNAAVGRMVARVRGGDGPWRAGERIYAASPIHSGYTGMYTDQEATITEVKDRHKHPDYPEFAAIPITLLTDSNEKIVAYLKPPESAHLIDGEASKLKSIAVQVPKESNSYGRVWSQYHAFMDAWADIRSVHALTAHRSQGSTFDNVWVDLRDIASCKNSNERWRLLYVACTRARKNVWLRR